jgi:hypothetical protein
MKSLDERISKLPEWARNYIRNLESEKRTLREELQNSLAGEGTTNTRIHRLGIGPDISLPDDSIISFVLGKDQEGWDDRIDVQIDRLTRSLEVRGVGTIRNILCVWPYASNTIYVDLYDSAQLRRRREEK